MMKVDEVKEEDASLHADDTSSSGSLPQSLTNSPLTQRRWSSGWPKFFFLYSI